MKALILANLGQGHYNDGEIVPSCFLPLYNKMTVIERQISLLNINGFTDDDICVLFGTGGIWDVESVKRRIDRIGTKKLFVPKNNVLKECIFESSFFRGEDILIIEGNCVFDIATIVRLRRFHEKNVLVLTDLLEPDGIKQMVAVDEDTVVAVRNTELITFPWTAFAGLAKLSAGTVDRLKAVSTCSRPFLDAVDDVLKDCELKAVKYDDLINGNLNGNYSSELTGGSYAKINFRLIVRKDGTGEGRAKLINEIKWLLSLPQELKPYFSEVLEYDIESDNVYYNVPYYGSRNLREHIFDGHLDADATCAFLENLLDWMFANVYSRKISETPDNWIMDKHIKRVLDRLPECTKKAPDLGKIIAADRVVINGVEYKNAKELFTRLANMTDFVRRLQPKELVMIHGDLHFQNILLYNGTDTGFILVDPRGERLGSDIYYDLGKLWHSFHAKYDFMHTDQFKYTLSWDKGTPIADFTLTNSFAEGVYDEIHEKFLRLIQKYDFIKNDPDWEMKGLFAEAAHLCSVSTFHIGKTKTADRAIVMYLTGVKLINEFFVKYIDGGKIGE
jgi:hypothetical protein